MCVLYTTSKAGKATVEMLPDWFDHAAALHASNTTAFAALAARSHGHMQCQGQGLMWGGLWMHADQSERSRANKLFIEACTYASSMVIK